MILFLSKEREVLFSFHPALDAKKGTKQVHLGLRAT